MYKSDNAAYYIKYNLSVVVTSSFHGKTHKKQKYLCNQGSIFLCN